MPRASDRFRWQLYRVTRLRAREKHGATSTAGGWAGWRCWRGWGVFLEARGGGIYSTMPPDALLWTTTHLADTSGPRSRTNGPLVGGELSFLGARGRRAILRAVPGWRITDGSRLANPAAKSPSYREGLVCRARGRLFGSEL